VPVGDALLLPQIDDDDDDVSSADVKRNTRGHRVCYQTAKLQPWKLGGRPVLCTDTSWRRAC